VKELQLKSQRFRAEREWDERFAATQDRLGDAVRAAKAEAERGDVLPCDPSDRSK